MKRRICAWTLTAALLLAVLPAPAQAAEKSFSKVRTYEDRFSDVTPSDWYYEDVKALYELGLTEGAGNGDVFDPNGQLTVAEVAAMASRLRSFYETGDSMSGRDAWGEDGGAWYMPYVRHLQSLEIVGQEFEGRYDRPATRGEMAHVLAGALPEELFLPVNRELVAEGRASGQYLQDVGEETPYQEDILLLYDWGIAGGAVGTGAFQPGDPISRCQAAAMVARLAYEERRLTLDWEILPAYSRKGTSMGDLVHSDGTFYEAPALDDAEKIDADVRYMLSRGQRELTLNYPANTLTNADISRLLSVFLDAVRQYVEQTYNYISVSFSLRTGYVQLTFSSSLYDESQTEFYREETMEYAVAVHDWMWETGQVTADMTEYDKARVYFAWICESCRYDHTYADMSHSAYRLFDEGIAVCDGYTAAYNLLLKLEGIDCGTWSAADHIWTTAELEGNTYHIDTTWGDQTYGVEYRYFAMTEVDAVSRF